eukprot:TRINITY_DN6813_c0_g1_i3.p1 TRINITY_DN6813_c0_g1~~TRINITY_DN6813_c0_g1_i3.p1  ORF type:complete len:485 (-),score=54.31 TRINITY_DN6813_c0_g1_i3:469-1899(-)
MIGVLTATVSFGIVLSVCLVGRSFDDPTSAVARVASWRDHAVDGCPARVERPYQLLSKQSDRKISDRYLELCEYYHVTPSVDVITQLELRGGRLELGRGSEFNERDMRPFIEFLEEFNGTELAKIRVLDCSRCNLQMSGILLIAQILRHPANCIEELQISNMAIGAEGMHYLEPALRSSRNLRILGLSKCGLNNAGGNIFLKLIEGCNETGVPPLETIDIRQNKLDFLLCTRLASTATHLKIQIDLSGNEVWDEVWNSVTHGVGELWAIGATRMILHKASGRPYHVKVATAVYCAALNAMFIVSTLYHSFFTLNQTIVHIFGIMDFCAIFILIAGSYSAFVGIMFYGKKWATCLLAFLWTTPVVAIMTSSFYHGPYGTLIHWVLYSAMCLTALSVIIVIVERIKPRGAFFLVVGGGAFLLGVPWFTSRGHVLGTFPNHAVWHLFVLAGAALHYHCMYYYVIPSNNKREDDGFTERI